MSDSPEKICSYLAAIAASPPPSPELVAEVEGLLLHRREGVQVSAARTLAAWSQQTSKTPLREWLIRTLARKRGSSVRAQAAQALGHFVAVEDAEWLLDLYFAETPRQTQFATVARIHELLPLLKPLPAAIVSERARQEFEGGSANRRRAALFALWAVGECVMLERFANSPDRDIAVLARNLLHRSPGA